MAGYICAGVIMENEHLDFRAAGDEWLELAGPHVPAETLEAYANARLDSAEREGVRTHLGWCVLCAGYLNAYVGDRSEDLVTLTADALRFLSRAAEAQESVPGTATTHQEEVRHAPLRALVQAAAGGRLTVQVEHENVRRTGCYVRLVRLDSNGNVNAVEDWDTTDADGKVQLGPVGTVSEEDAGRLAIQVLPPALHAALSLNRPVVVAFVPRTVRQFAPRAVQQRGADPAAAELRLAAASETQALPSSELHVEGSRRVLLEITPQERVRVSVTDGDRTVAGAVVQLERMPLDAGGSEICAHGTTDADGMVDLGRIVDFPPPGEGVVYRLAVTYPE